MTWCCRISSWYLILVSQPATCKRAVVPPWLIPAHTMTMPPPRLSTCCSIMFPSTYIDTWVSIAPDRKNRYSSENKSVLHLAYVHLIHLIPQLHWVTWVQHVTSHWSSKKKYFLHQPITNYLVRNLRGLRIFVAVVVRFRRCHTRMNRAWAAVVTLWRYDLGMSLTLIGVVPYS